MSELQVDKTYPLKLINRARATLLNLDKGNVKAKRIVFHRLAGDLYKLNAGKRYRLLSNDLVLWRLVSHESYNHLFK